VLPIKYIKARRPITGRKTNEWKNDQVQIQTYSG
jgi:hypothetical protein